MPTSYLPNLLLAEVGPISIIRVPEGCLGFAMNNALPEILLPGRHVRKDASFKFSASYPLSQEVR